MQQKLSLSMNVTWLNRTNFTILEMLPLVAAKDEIEKIDTTSIYVSMQLSVSLVKKQMAFWLIISFTYYIPSQ